MTVIKVAVYLDETTFYQVFTYFQQADEIGKLSLLGNPGMLGGSSTHL